MDTGTLTGSTVGFVLAMVFITHMLVRYEEFLNDKKLARGFLYGFIAAVIAYLVEQLGFFSFNVQDMERDVGPAFISIFGIAVLHTAMKGLALNHKALWDGKDMNVPFYGAFYGFIFGAVYVTVIISKTLNTGEVDGWEPVFLFILAVGIILFHGSTSVIMGWGVAKLRMHGYAARIALLHIFLNVLIFLSAVGLIPYGLMVVLSLMYGSLLYGFAYQVVLPESLTKEQRKKLFPTVRPVGRRLSRLSAKDTTASSSGTPSSSPSPLTPAGDSPDGTDIIGTSERKERDGDVKGSLGENGDSEGEDTD
jgi:hypothetical protein